MTKKLKNNQSSKVAGLDSALEAQNTHTSRSDNTKTTFQNITLQQIDKSRQIISNMNRKSWNMFSNSWFFYLLAWVVLSVYAGKACPFIDENFIFSFFDNLLLQVGLAVFISLAPIYLLRFIISFMIGEEKIFNWKLIYYTLFEAFFFLIWLYIMWRVSNTDKIDLLLESKLKITIGPFVLGFFSVLNMVLIRQRFIHLIETNNKRKKIDIRHFISLRVKLIFITTVVLTLVGIVIALIGLKNFWWLVHNVTSIMATSATAAAGVASVFKEIIFIIAVFIGFMIISIINYTTNLKLIFTILNNTIYKVFSKDFDNFVIPSINDEFGVMGENISIISEEIKEKEVIKSTFGKFVSPKIAEMILQSGTGLDKGENREVVILFSDIRGFTRFTNTSDAKAVVNSLNAYFTVMVEIIEKYSGMVDKFIGDAIMSIFGYDDIKKGINHAVLAACHMQNHLHVTGNKFRIGIGIGVGEAVIGLVGAPNRLDFTAIGDVVNTASRLESATPKEGVDIMIGDKVYDGLVPELRDMPWREFTLSVKGIEDGVPAYGLMWNDIVDKKN